MLPKSQRKAYIGYDKGSKSIKYYNANTKNILASQNFHFLSHLEASSNLLEEITIEPDAPLEGEHDPLCEGEREEGTHSVAKRKAEINIDPREP